ncbi:MAG: hypothetical protein WBW33_18210 [Bryobacteraceae bacterium]
MKRLAFFAGKWSGDATTRRGPNQTIKVTSRPKKFSSNWTGSVLLIEGSGRNPDTGDVMFNAPATIAYDDTTKVYRFRAYNDGRYLDTELKVPDHGFEWGYKAGSVDIRFAMHWSDAGEWVETGDLSSATIRPSAPST